MRKRIFNISHIKAYLTDMFTRNLFLKFTAFVVTLFFWFIAIGSRNIEFNKKVLINFITASDIVVSNDAEREVEFRLSGPRAFLRDIMDKDYVINVDFRNKKTGFISYRIYDHMVDFPIGVKVLSILPDVINAKIEQIKNRTVPVLPSFVGLLPEGYKMKKYYVEPARIDITGATSVVSSMEKVFLEPVDLSRITQDTTIDLEIDIKDRKKLKKTSSTNFSLYLQVAPIISSKRFHNIKIDVQGSTNFKIRPDKITIYVDGPKSIIDKLTIADFRAVIDLQNKKTGVYNINPKFDIPENIRLVSKSPEMVRVWVY